jgi:hypothetical protein
MKNRPTNKNPINIKPPFYPILSWTSFGAESDFMSLTRDSPYSKVKRQKPITVGRIKIGKGIDKVDVRFFRFSIRVMIEPTETIKNTIIALLLIKIRKNNFSDFGNKFKSSSIRICPPALSEKDAPRKTTHINKYLDNSSAPINGAKKITRMSTCTVTSITNNDKHVTAPMQSKLRTDLISMQSSSFYKKGCLESYILTAFI